MSISTRNPAVAPQVRIRPPKRTHFCYIESRCLELQCLLTQQLQDAQTQRTVATRFSARDVRRIYEGRAILTHTLPHRHRSRGSPVLSVSTRRNSTRGPRKYWAARCLNLFSSVAWRERPSCFSKAI